MLTKPILYSVPAFDASNGYTFTFEVIGGNQVVKNEIMIKNNVSNDTVYTSTVSTFEFKHTVPPNILKNGTYYNVSIRTYSATDEVSDWSMPVQFYCYTTPVVEFTNMPVNNIIENSSYSFEATYNQLEKERMNLYRFNLYNDEKILVATSDDQYIGNNEEPPNVISYTFSGFEDDAFYFIECVVSTINNTVVTTGLVPFTVNYVNPNIYAIITLENNACKGWIKITSNATLIEGTNNPEPPKYIDNEKVDLTEDGSFVRWDDGFSINGNFSLYVKGSNFNPYTKIMEMVSTENSESGFYKIDLYYMLGYEPSDDEELKCYFLLEVYSGKFGIPYTIHSSFRPIVENKNIIFGIRRINNIYDLDFNYYNG